MLSSNISACEHLRKLKQFNLPILLLVNINRYDSYCLGCLISWRSESLTILWKYLGLFRLPPCFRADQFQTTLEACLQESRERNAQSHLPVRCSCVASCVITEIGTVKLKLFTLGKQRYDENETELAEFEFLRVLKFRVIQNGVGRSSLWSRWYL